MHPLHTATTFEFGGGIRETTVSQSSQPGYSMRDLRDMTGDGIVDWVETTSGATGDIRITPGRGPNRSLDASVQGSFDTGSAFVWAGNRGVSESLGDSQAPNPPQEAIGGWVKRWETSGFYDVTGDGIPDYVTYLNGSFEFNEGTGSGFVDFASNLPTAQAMDGGTRVSYHVQSFQLSTSPYQTTEYIVTTQALMDFDGDGFPELVRSAEDPFHETEPSTWLVAGSSVPGAGTIPLLLKETSTAGAHDVIEYGRPKQDGSAKTPFAPWAVKRIEQHDDGAGAFTPTRESEFTYEDPVYDPQARVFRGNTFVTEVEAGVGIGRSVWKEFLTDEYGYGLLHVEGIGGPEDFIRKTVYDWEAVEMPGGGGGRIWVRPTATTNYEMDEVDTQTATRKTFGYFALESPETDMGLTRQVSDLGYVDSVNHSNEDAADDRVDTNSYFVSSAPTSQAPSYSVPRLAGLQASKRESGTGELISQTDYLYDPCAIG